METGDAIDVIQAVHGVTVRTDVCSVRVCETSLSILEILLGLSFVSMINDGDADRQEADENDDAAAAAADPPAGAGPVKEGGVPDPPPLRAAAAEDPRSPAAPF